MINVIKALIDLWFVFLLIQTHFNPALVPQILELLANAGLFQLLRQYFGSLPVVFIVLINVYLVLIEWNALGLYRLGG